LNIRGALTRGVTLHSPKYRDLEVSGFRHKPFEISMVATMLMQDYIPTASIKTLLSEALPTAVNATVWLPAVLRVNGLVA
jgi:hypothetical protein